MSREVVPFKKEIIAVDMDELFFPFAAYFVEHHNKNHGTELTFADFNSYRFETIIGASLEETVRRVHAATEADHSHVKPVDNSLESIHNIKRVYDLVMATSRDPKHEEISINWMNMVYGSDLLLDSYHVGHDGTGKEPIKKVDICKKVGAIALVDDSPKHLEECIAENIPGVAFGEYEWNKDSEFTGGVLPAGVTRCKDWPAVEVHFGVA